MTKIFMWKVNCTPFDKRPIRCMTIQVVAENRKEAELIVLNEAHKFFDLDMIYTWSEPLEGYVND